MSVHKLNILMFVPQFPYPIVGGLEKQAYELSKKLIELGHNIHVLSGKINNENKDIENSEGIKIHRFKWYRVKVFRFIFTPFSIFIYLNRNKNKFDILHVHQQSWIGLYVIFLSKLLGIPVLTKLPSWGELGVESIVNSFLGNLRKKILFSSNGIVVITKQSINELLKYDYPNENIYFSPNGIEITPKVLRPNQNEKIIVVFVGRLIELKQVDKLLLVWDDLCLMTKENIELKICGNGTEYNNLLSLSKKVNKLNNVQFLGHVHDTKSILNSSDIFVLPSRVEGNSNAILEAMISGLPIVSTLTGGTPFMVGYEGQKFLSNVNDFTKIKSDLLLLIENKHLRHKLGENMRYIVENTFSINIVAKKYITIYYEILKRKKTI